MLVASHTRQASERGLAGPGLACGSSASSGCRVCPSHSPGADLCPRTWASGISVSSRLTAAAPGSTPLATVSPRWPGAGWWLLLGDPWPGGRARGGYRQ